MHGNTKAAIDIFRTGDYDRCVSLLIKCFNAGYDKDYILDFLRTNFIETNEDAFQKIYTENSTYTAEMPYEKCSIDYIPVSSIKYYMLSKDTNEFLGEVIVDRARRPLKVDFHSLLITGTWNVSEIIRITQETVYNKVYVMLDTEEKKFRSFFKLPVIGELMRNVVVFSSVEEMEGYFRRESTTYLPKVFYPKKEQAVVSILNNIHKDRISHGKNKNDKVFLTIAIPSVNRGHRALECAKRIMESEYDAEIEILVSDNGSVSNTEGYKEIERMQEIDSRLRYVRRPVMQYMGYNLINIIRNAKGRYILFTSDEDIIDNEQMYEGLNFLRTAHELEVGTIIFSVDGDATASYEKDVVYSDTLSIVANALGTNYITGLTFDREKLTKTHSVDILEEYLEKKSNEYAVYYPHCTLSAVSLLKSGSAFCCSSIRLFKEGCSEESGTVASQEVPVFFQVEKRCMQQNDAITMLRDNYSFTDSELLGVVNERISRTYQLQRVLFYWYGEKQLKDALWPEICKEVYNKTDDYITKLETENKHVIEEIKTNNKMQYLDAISDNPALRYMSDDEMGQYGILSSVIRYRVLNGQDIKDIDYADMQRIVEKIKKQVILVG